MEKWRQVLMKSDNRVAVLDGNNGVTLVKTFWLDSS